MKYTDLGDRGPDFIREMDSQGYHGSRDSGEDDAGKKEYYGKVAKPGDVVKQANNILNKAYNDKEAEVEEAEEDAFVDQLSGLQQWDVMVMNNFYGGKYPDYSARYYSVVAASPEEARQVVVDNADYVLQDLLSRKLQNGKKVLPRGSALPIEDKRVGKAKPGTLTTMGFKKMLSPDGVKSFKFASGKIVDREEQGVEEGNVDEASLAQMRDYFDQTDSDSVKVDRNYDAPSKKQNPLGVPPEIQALVNKMYHAGKISQQEFEILRRFQQKTKINVGVREADANPYAIGMAQAMKSTGDKPPLKKSTINKAHKIARAIEKGE
jgi:hypothetical protein